MRSGQIGESFSQRLSSTVRSETPSRHVHQGALATDRRGLRPGSRSGLIEHLQFPWKWTRKRSGFLGGAAGAAPVVQSTEWVVANQAPGVVRVRTVKTCTRACAGPCHDEPAGRLAAAAGDSTCSRSNGGWCTEGGCVRCGVERCYETGVRRDTRPRHATPGQGMPKYGRARAAALAAARLRL